MQPMCSPAIVAPTACPAWKSGLDTYEAHLVNTGATILRLDAKYFRESSGYVELVLCRNPVAKTLDAYCDVGCPSVRADAPCLDIDAFRETQYDRRAIEVVEEKSYNEHSVVYIDVKERVKAEASDNLMFMTFCVFVSLQLALTFSPFVRGFIYWSGALRSDV